VMLRHPWRLSVIEAADLVRLVGSTTDRDVLTGVQVLGIGGKRSSGMPRSVWGVLLPGYLPCETSGRPSIKPLAAGRRHRGGLLWSPLTVSSCSRETQTRRLVCKRKSFQSSQRSHDCLAPDKYLRLFCCRRFSETAAPLHEIGFIFQLHSTKWRRPTGAATSSGPPDLSACFE